MKKLLSLCLLLASMFMNLQAEESHTVIPENGIRIQTTPIANGKANIAIDCDLQTTLVKGVRLKVDIVYGNTTYYTRTRSYKAGKPIHNDICISNAHLWTPDYPNLYYAIFTIYENNVEVGKKKIMFPIRKVEISEQSATLNGRRLTLNGVMYDGNEMFKTGKEEDGIEFRLKWMHNIGCNAIGCNGKPSAMLQHLCDKTGIIAINTQDPTEQKWTKNFVQVPLEYGYQPTNEYYQYFKTWKNKNAACFTTTAPANHIEIVPDYVGDLTFVHIRLLGEDNYLCHQANNTINVSVDGDCTLVGIVSGENIRTVAGKQASGNATQGILTAVVRGNGAVSARSEGLVGSLLQINHIR